MVLQDLADNIGKAFSNLRKKLTIDEESIKLMLIDIGKALEEADIPSKLVEGVLRSLKKQLLSENFKKYSQKQNAARHIVWDELCKLLDPKVEAFKPIKGKTNVLMFVGLQGSGKTTTITKFAYYYKRRKWKCALVCADTFRAGAFDQLKQNATKIGVPFYGSHTETDPVKLASKGVEIFKKDKYDLILVDTSGRHKQEKSLFREMSQIEKAIKPNDIVFIMDGTIGQAAMDQANAFKKTVNIGSCIITKLDGSGKGGGALAAVAATKSPITFVGTGEHPTNFEMFSAKSFASRLLGYMDPQALINKIPVEEMNPEKQKKMFQRMVKGTFTMRDLHEQLSLIMKMGPIGDIMNMLSPQMARMMKGKEGTMEQQFKKYLTIMDSMTNDELDEPKFDRLGKDISRIKRLAIGSGCSLAQVAQLFSQYKEFKKVFGMLGKRFNLKEMAKNQDDPSYMMKMMQNLVPGGMRGASKMQRMMQQMQRMGGAPKGMRMKMRK